MPDTTLMERAAFNHYAEQRSRTMAALLGVDVASLRTGEWVGKLYMEWMGLTREAREDWILIAKGELRYVTNVDTGC